MATACPGSACREIPLSASMFPYWTCSSRTSRRAIVPSGFLRGEAAQVVVLAAEVGLDDGRVVLDHGGLVQRDEDAVIEDGDTVRDAHHKRHVVLDQNDRD